MALCFMFPVLNGKYSGALNVASSLAVVAARQGVPIKVIDYEAGLLRSALISSGIEFDFVDLNSRHYVDQIVDDDTVFGFNNDIYVFPVLFKNNPKIFIYDVYYPFWRKFIRPAGIRLPLEKFYLDALASSKLFEMAGAFMETMGVEELVLRLPGVSAAKCRVVPVSIAIPDFRGPSRRVTGEVRLTYIGRSEAWKLFPLVKFVEDVVETRIFDDARIVFNVIVSDVAVAREMIATHCGTELDIEFHFYENLRTIDLEKIICEGTDVGLAMGTSVLEFGRWGVPCLVLDFSHKRINGDVGYRWLYESRGFSLGRDVSGAGYELGRDLIVVLSEYLSSASAVARKCYEYTRSNHNRDVNYLRLLGFVNDACVRIRDVYIPHLAVMNFLQECRRKALGRSKYERY